MPEHPRSLQLRSTDDARGDQGRGARKVTGLQRPGAADAGAFDEAVESITASTERLLGSLQARTALRTREHEREKARARWQRRGLAAPGR